MKQEIVTYLPWLISVTSVWMLIVVGKKKRYSWKIGYFNQVVWVIWIVASENWGLIPMAVAYSVIYVINDHKWKKTI